MKLRKLRLGKWWWLLIAFAAADALSVERSYGWRMMLINIAAWLFVFWFIRWGGRKKT